MRIPNKIKISVLFICCLFSTKAQEVKTTRDVGVWLGVGVNYELNQHWDFDLEQEIRSFDNSTAISKVLTDLSADYKINGHFTLRAGLRYAYDRKKDFTLTHDIRYNLDFKVKGNITQNLEWQYRLRYQHNYINLFTFTPDTRQKSNVRNRLKLAYTLNTHEIYFTSEIFREFTFFKQPEFNRLRLSLGDEVDTKLGDFDFGFSYQRELNVKSPLNFFFADLKYTFKFKR